MQQGKITNSILQAFQEIVGKDQVLADRLRGNRKDVIKKKINLRMKKRYHKA